MSNEDPYNSSYDLEKADVTNRKCQRTGYYIKMMELENFKSYKGKHKIGPFSKRFTCIVGPNGSGKSNLMDALSFVLGISSSQIRGTNIKDFIFRQEGQNDDNALSTNDELNCASSSVSLIFGHFDCEDQSIQFCRKILPSGATRFIINEKITSQESYLKKLEELNILVKARNFLVFQGDVEDIAQRGPKELTKLFEQISGSDTLIKEYENLSNEQCVTHILLHNDFQRRRLLEAERRELQKQVEEVEEYESLESIKKKKIIEFTLFKLFCNECIGGEIFNEKQNIDKLIEDLNIDLDKSKSDIKELESKMASYILDNKNNQKVLDNFEKEVASNKSIILENENAISYFKNDLTALNKQSELILATKKKNDKLVANYAESIKKLTFEMNVFDEVSSDSIYNYIPKEDYEEYSNCKKMADLASVSLKEELLHLEREYKNLVGIIDISEKEIDEIEKQIKVNSGTLETLNTKISELESRLQTITKALNENQSNKELLELDNCNLLDRIAKLNNRKDRCEELLKHFDSKKIELEKDSNLRKLVDNLKNIIGYSVSDKTSAGNFNSIIFGRLGDMCHLSNKKYATALNAALGKYFDYVVVNSWETAEKCIFWLKQHRKAPVNFLPLNSIKKSNFNNSLRCLCSGNQNRSVALDNVHISDERIEPALSFVLQDTIFTEDITDARTIFYKEAPKIGVSLRVVTVNGENIMKNGNISLDTKSRSRKFTVDLMEYKKVHSDLDSIKMEMNHLESVEMSGQQKLIKLKDNEKRMRLDMIAIQTKYNIWQQNYVDKMKLAESLEEQLKEKVGNLDELKESCNKLAGNTNKLRQLIVQSDKKYFENISKKLNIKDICSLEESLRSTREERLRKSAKLQKQLTVLTGEYNNFLQRDKKLCDTILDSENKIKKCEESIQGASEKIKDAQQNIDNLLRNIDEVNGSLKLLEMQNKQNEEILQSIKNKIRDIQQHIRHLNKEKSLKQEQLDTLNEELISILKAVVLENIKIPLKSGTFEDIKKYWYEINAASFDEEKRSDKKTCTEGNKTKLSDIEPPIILVDYDELTELKQSLAKSKEKIENEFNIYRLEIEDISNKMRRITPNLKSRERLSELDAQITALIEDQKEIKKKSIRIDKEYKNIRRKRSDIFFKCFQTVKSSVDKFYEHLTRENDNIGGKAFLDLDDENLEEPFSCGIIFHVMPPSKRFRDIQHLSGGEKSMAALALLFALQSYFPSPFFMLDEVDAALDPHNVQSVANFLKSAPFQSIVISLKDRLFSKADSLIGVYKNKESQTSAIITLNLNNYSKITEHNKIEGSSLKFSNQYEDSEKIPAKLRKPSIKDMNSSLRRNNLNVLLESFRSESIDSYKNITYNIGGSDINSNEENDNPNICIIT
ncbi:putative structural maintenance of chromosomes protein [Cryptosporidium serpentis]